MKSSQMELYTWHNIKLASGCMCVCVQKGYILPHCAAKIGIISRLAADATAVCLPQSKKEIAAHVAYTQSLPLAYS